MGKKGGISRLRLNNMENNKFKGLNKSLLFKLVITTLLLTVLLTGCAKSEVKKGEEVVIGKEQESSALKDNPKDQEEDIITKQEAQDTIKEETDKVKEIDTEKIKKEIEEKLRESGENVTVEQVYAPKKDFNIDLEQRFSSHPEDSKADLIAITKELLGLKAMDFSFSKTDGTVVSLSDFKEKPLILEIMNTGCGACISMIPEIKAFETKYPEIPFVSVSPNENEQDILNAKKTNKGFNNVLVGGNDIEFSQNYPFKYYPTTLFIDKDGYIADVLIGTASSSELFEIYQDVNK